MDSTLTDKHGGPQGGFPASRSWGDRRRATEYGGEDYVEMIAALRDLLDNVAAARPDADSVRAMTRSFTEWSGKLAELAVGERDQVFAHRTDTPGRGQTMSPVFVPLTGDENEVSGSVRFGRYYLGGNGAVHGGAIPLLFDEVLGRLANAGDRTPSRTAYLKVDYRSITPIEKDLQVTARFVSEQGRKRLLVGELRDGDVLCAEADGLFVQLKPGQP